MTTSLPRVTHEHHERLMHQVEGMPAVGAALLSAPMPELRPRLEELSHFLNDLLLPHIEAAERAIHPELERMLQNRHSMAPMRREHDEIRRLATEYTRLGAIVADGHVTLGNTLALRRVMFQLYALVKVHLAEEEAYIRMMDKGVSTDLADAVAAALEHPVA